MSNRKDVNLTVRTTEKDRSDFAKACDDLYGKSYAVVVRELVFKTLKKWRFNKK